MTLDAVQVRDCSDVGVAVSMHAVMTARRVDVARCAVGLHVARAVMAERSCFRECKVAGGLAVVGMLCHGPSHCDRCQPEEVRGVEVGAEGDCGLTAAPVCDALFPVLPPIVIEGVD